MKSKKRNSNSKEQLLGKGMAQKAAGAAVSRQDRIKRDAGAAMETARKARGAKSAK